MIVVKNHLPLIKASTKIVHLRLPKNKQRIEMIIHDLLKINKFYNCLFSCPGIACTSRKIFYRLPLITPMKIIFSKKHAHPLFFQMLPTCHCSPFLYWLKVLLCNATQSHRLRISQWQPAFCSLFVFSFWVYLLLFSYLFQMRGRRQLQSKR